MYTNILHTNHEELSSEFNYIFSQYSCTVQLYVYQDYIYIFF